MPGITDCCVREAAWLQTHGDGLPALLAANGGPFDIIQAYWPGAREATQKRGIYVVFGTDVDQRPNAIRVRPQLSFLIKITWPVKTGTPPPGGVLTIAETEQANFAAALQNLVERVRGPFNDKTHGGRFLSVGEVYGPASRGGWPTVRQEDPEVTIPAHRALRASFTYNADDLEVVG